MHDEDTVRIPLYARDGSVKAYAIVDTIDAAFVQQWRWMLRHDGYVARDYALDGRTVCVRLHRALLGLAPGDGWDGDHINRDKLDNRRCNLRIVTRAANAQNKGSRRGSSSQYKGVSWHEGRRKWQARASVNGKDVFVGYFADEAEAAEAARAVRLRLLPYATD